MERFEELPRDCKLCESSIVNMSENDMKKLVNIYKKNRYHKTILTGK